MMTLYAESSAVLPWLLGREAGGTVRKLLAEADVVFSSELTLLECERVFVRAIALGRTSEAAIADRRALLSHASAHWHLIRLDAAVIERAARPFPGEPVSFFTACHLAAALVARTAVPGVTLLSLSEPIRAVGRQLGLAALPASSHARDATAARGDDERSR